MTASPPRLPPLPTGTVAIGWASVELERAERELAGLVDAGQQFRVAPDSMALGARCLVGSVGPAADALRIVLLEPATEGRLAAHLARYGEGWAARWVAAAEGASTVSLRAGPLGRERLLVDLADEVFRLGLETTTIAP